MSGATVLDVGASDGFFSFEFERRGASRVLAIDTNNYDGSVAIDPSPAHMDAYFVKYRLLSQGNYRFQDVYSTLGVPLGHQFLAAKALLGSRVEYQNLSIYELSSQENTKYDFVFCGDLINHLKNPLLALEKLVPATGKECIISLASVLPEVQGRYKKLAGIIKFLNRILGMLTVDTRRALEYVGNDSGGSFFHFYPETFRQACLASGFRQVEIYSLFDLPNLKLGTNNRHAVFHCSP